MSESHTSPSNLDHCVQTLKSISKNLTSHSPKAVADLYISIVGLLCHLKADQALLHNTLQQNDDPNKENGRRCPSPDKIPAMSAVVQDAKLFQALLRCLKPVGAETDVNTKQMGRGSLGGAATGEHNHHHHHHSQFQNRKRSHSMSSEVDHSSKAIKLSHSPNIGSRLTYQKKQQQQQQQQLEGGGKQPTFNVQAVAATILFSAFQHLDHWPVPLIKAYAEDSFGQRLWVDDDRCQFFVENLSLAHNKKDGIHTELNTEISDDDWLADASKVADSYRNFKERDDDIAEPNQRGLQGSPQVQKQQRRGSHGSVASSISANAAKKPSESGEQKARKSLKKTLSKMGGKGNASDSSSGEEDEEVVVTTESFGDDAAGGDGEGDGGGKVGESSPSSHVDSPTKPSAPRRSLYPVTQQKLNLTRVRQRYFGANLECAHHAISSSLSDRLDAKAKQNSLLLQSLLSFTSVSSVRKLVSGYLERWLQSPGLSNLARSLFTSTVKMMKNVDPPLSDDLLTIDNILAMRLKANQLNFHLENVTAIASGIPTAAVTHHIYLRLLRKVLQKMDSTDDAATSEHLKMIGVVYAALEPSLSSDGIAASLLNIMVNPGDEASMDRKEISRVERNQLVKKLRSLIRLIASQLGQSFDGCRLAESLLSYDFRSDTWSIRDEEDKARLMFQCVMLLVHRSNKHQQKLNSQKKDLTSLKRNLLISRKLLLTWCCNDYGHLCLSKKGQTQCKRWQANGAKKNAKASTEVIGAGAADYGSILGGQGSTAKKTPKWLALSRCVLFMERADSSELQRFIYPDESVADNESDWQDMRYRIEQCCANGADLDDEMIWIVLKSSSLDDDGISPDVTLPLLENLFECCNKNRSSMLRLADERLVWELYSLVEFEAPKPRGLPDSQSEAAKGGQSEAATGGQFEDAEEESDEKIKKDPMDGEGGQINGVTAGDGHSAFPRLAYPGMWWRVTVIVLVMCGASPEKIAATVWNDHPTVQAMIKMVISGRYRFPTVDCDDESRDEIKKAEQSIRDEEARVAELLFLPPAPKVEKVKKTFEASYGGSRMSARQREKREKKWQREQEKAAAKAQEVASRRKKQLKAVQKTIMLWDPKGPARKPPREAAELLLAVEELFGLSEVFQRSLTPDFLLRTIGETTRGAIERAYHWLIPIISQLPDTIARLPPSASCFLLLRATGTEGDEQAQLKELSAPLLRHVSDSLKGNLGESDAILAFDLLMTDVASNNPDRRRCGRRVLKDAIGQLDEDNSTEEKSTSIPSWILNILRVKHAKGLAGDAIRHMSTAITFERGRVLRSFLIGLEKIISFANLNNVGKWEFASVLIDLISSRQSVCAEAMDTFPDLRSLAIRIVHEEFSCYIQNPSKQNSVEADAAVIMSVCHSGDRQQVTLPLSVLRSATVLLSIWKEDDSAVSEDAASAVNDLVAMLMLPSNAQDNGNKEGCETDGFASAKALGSGKSAVSVESWVMLAKSRSDAIAKRAALTAPTGYLPRLLLCSGLARASLLTMIDRIGRMGDNAEDRDRVFHQLLAPSMTREWDIGRISHNREVARKLLGRLSAYLRLHDISFDKEEENISTTFLSWLPHECGIHEKKNKKGKSKSKSKTSSYLQSVADASSLLSKFSHEVHTRNENLEQSEEDAEMSEFRTFRVADIELQRDSNNSAYAYIEECMKMSKPNDLEKWLGDQFTEYTEEQEKPKKEEKKTEETDPLAFLAAVAQSEEIDLTRLASSLLRSYLGLRNQQDSFTRIILTWVPFLSRASGSAEFWRLIFCAQSDAFDNVWDKLLSNCAESWCPSHVSSCQDWIVSKSRNVNPTEFSLGRMARYLVLASRQHSVQIESFTPAALPAKSKEDDVVWGASRDFVIAAASIALGCMKHETKIAGDADYCSRNDLPDWLVLLLLLARCGAQQMKLVCEAVLECFSQPGTSGETNPGNNPIVLRAVILRLYACNPYAMNLGIAKIRTVLMEAAEVHCKDWLSWRSPLDDQLQDMIDSVVAGAGQKMLRPLLDISKKHPLLILRKIHIFIRYLEEDATCRGGEQQRSGGGVGSDKRGVVDGQSVSGKLEATMPSGKRMAVVVRHWGFSYTEPIWVALLDVVFAVPGPVLFRCGLKMGLLEYLNVNLRLMFVQSQLRRKEGGHSRLKEKLNDFFKAFQSSNASGWDYWLESNMSELQSFGEMRNILMCCNFISAEQAMMDRINKRKKERMLPEQAFDNKNKKKRINKAA